MSYDVFIIDSDALSSAGGAICKSILAYDSVLGSSVVTGTNDDPSYPFINATDHSYNTEYSPAGAGPVVIIVSFTDTRTINYFAVISKNAEQSGVSFDVEVLRADTGLYETVSGFGSMTDGVPKMAYFNAVNCYGLRITMTYISKPYIMTMAAGEAVVMPRALSLGAQPGHLSNIDEVEIFHADEGLNIAPSRRLARGYQLKGTINYVKMTTIEQFWRGYSDHVKDVKTLFFMWNDKLPDQVIYGVQMPDRLTKPSYKTSLFSSIDFDIVGWA